MRPDGELVIGTVVMSMPEYGHAFVDTWGGTWNTKERLFAFLPYSDATCGTLILQHIQEGSTVVCMRVYHKPHTAYILTALNATAADMTDTLAGRVFYNTNQWTTRKSRIFRTMIDQVKDFVGTMFRNNSNSVDSDVLPGDTDIVNNGGSSSIHVGRYLVQLKGSPIAFIDVSAMQDQIRMVAMKVETHTTATYRKISDEVSVQDSAISAAEAFGMQDGSDIEENWEDVDAYAVPFFRMQQLEGPSLDGRESIITAFPFDVDMHTDSTEPPVVYKARTAVSGERMVASAKGISSIKTPDIKAVLQFGYRKVNARTTGDEPRKLDLLTPYEYTEDDQKEPEVKKHLLDQEIMDAAINKVVDKLMTEDYLPVLKARMSEAGLIVSEHPLSSRFQEHTETGPTEQQAYQPPKTLEITDPVTGRVHLYFDSTSFITQEPDGSILICDGYGSEIRMSQGHIYISPALDLQLRPGRDMWGLIPRHMTLDSQGYAIINSNRSVYLRAVGDMQLAAAADENGHGKLTIECDDKTGSKNSGLILRSLGNAALTGYNMYVGINKGTSRTENRTEDMDRPGTIIIDAGYQGTIMERSTRHQVSSQIITMVTDSGQSHSAITISSNNIGLYAQVVNMPAQLKMTPINGSQKVSVVVNGTEQQISLDVSAAPDIMLKETTISHGQIRTAGSIVSLANVIARGGAFVSLSYPIQDDTVRTFIPIDVPNIAVNYTFTNNTGSYFVQQLNKTIYQDYYIGDNCFKFPETYGVVSGFTVPGMVWQEQTRKTVDNMNSVTWEEKAVKDTQGKETASYPGWSVWNDSWITQEGYEKQPLMSAYITNTRKETKNG